MKILLTLVLLMISLRVSYTNKNKTSIHLKNIAKAKYNFYLNKNQYSQSPLAIKDAMMDLYK